MEIEEFQDYESTLYMCYCIFKCCSAFAMVINKGVGGGGGVKWSPN